MLATLVLSILISALSSLSQITEEGNSISFDLLSLHRSGTHIIQMNFFFYKSVYLMHTSLYLHCTILKI